MASPEAIRTAILSLITERRQRVGGVTFYSIWVHVTLTLNLCDEAAIHVALNDLVMDGDLMVVKTWAIDPSRDLHRPKRPPPLEPQ